MRQLYPPSTQRLPEQTEEMLDALVHDTTQVEPGSVQYAAANGLLVELERIRMMLTQDHTLPQRADVRQTGHVSADEAGRVDEGSIENFLLGPPDSLAFHPYREYEPPPGVTFPTIDSGAMRPEDIVVQVDNFRATFDENQNIEQLSNEEPQLVLSEGPADYSVHEIPGIREQEIAVQMRGLEITFAGVGEFTITTTFTGVGNYVYSTDLPAFYNRTGVFGYAERPLNMYDSDGNRVEYEEVQGGSLEIYGAEPNGQTYTLYYEGEYVHNQSIFDSPGPVAQETQTTVSLSPISKYLNDIPPRENVTCVQQKDVLVDLYLRNGTKVEVTREGFVGNVYVGHSIKHVLRGAYHIFVLGEDQITLVEPESRLHYHYSAPPGTFALTWLPNGKLGVLTGTPSKIEALEIEEVRNPPLPPDDPTQLE